MKKSQIQKLLVTVNEIMLPTSSSCWGLQEAHRLKELLAKVENPQVAKGNP